MLKEFNMFNTVGRFYLHFLLVSGFCVATSICLSGKTTLYAANKQIADSEDISTAQRFEKVFEQVVEQVKPAVVSITSIKVFKHTQQKQRKMPNDQYHSQPAPDLIRTRNEIHSGISGTSSAMIFSTNFSNRGLLRANIRFRDLVQV